MADPLPKVTIPEAHRPLRFVLLTLAVAASLLVATVALNVYVDPRGDFPGQRYTPLVEDVPREKLRLYREASPADAVIVGSSRAMPLPPAPTGMEDAFNFAILGGGLRDDRLAYDLVRREQGPPELLVIVLDSFQLMELPDGRLWSEVLGSRSAPDYLGQPAPLSSYAAPLQDSLSLDYLGDSLRVLRYTHVDGYPEPANAFLPDGQGTRPRVDPAVEAGTYDLQAAFEANWDRFLGNIYTDESAPSPGQVQELQDLVARAQADRAQVWVVLPPFFPPALERLRPIDGFGRLQDAAVEAAAATCNEGVSVFDYTEVEAFAGDPGGFYDGYHVTPANGARLIEAMRAGQGDLCRGGPGS